MIRYRQLWRSESSRPRSAPGSPPVRCLGDDGRDSAGPCCWPGRADGSGSTLEIKDTGEDYDRSGSWRSSSEFGGSPGKAGLGPDNRIVFNEILAHTDPPDVDMIELFNTTAEAIEITNWYVSDSPEKYFSFKIEQPTTVVAGGYHVLTETQFGDGLGALNSFHGEDLWLIEADAAGKPIRFVD